MPAAGNLREPRVGLYLDHGARDGLRKDRGFLAAHEEDFAIHPIPRVPHEDARREREGREDARDLRIEMQAKAAAFERAGAVHREVLPLRVGDLAPPAMRAAHVRLDL